MQKTNSQNLVEKIKKVLYYIAISFVCIITAILVSHMVLSQMNVNNENYKPPISLYTIVSPSMTPAIKVYDVVVNVRVKDSSKINVGDIITYKSTSATSEGMTITHRVIVKAKNEDGTYQYITQGDNNSKDDGIYVTFDNVIGKKIFIIPQLGKLQFILANKKGWILIVLILIALYIFRDIYRLLDLIGLNKRVNAVINNEEEQEEKQNQKIIEEERKEILKNKILNVEINSSSYVRSEHESLGFLEKYNETIDEVKDNRYETIAKPIEVKVASPEVSIPKQKSVVENQPEIKTVKEPKSIEKPKTISYQPEILDTDDLTMRIKEYDRKLKELDDILKELESKRNIVKEEKVVEKDNYLTGKRIKVTNVELTKNQKKENRILKKSVLIPTILPDNEEKKVQPNKEIDIKSKEEQVKQHENKKQIRKLNLNPKSTKSINRRKSSNKKKLNLNPKQVKEINRPGKAKKKPAPVIKENTNFRHLIEIKKIEKK